MEQFPTLYSYDSKGNTREWKIRVENIDEEYYIICEFGIVGGRKIITKKQVFQGKNKGKKNETNKEQQAFSEAKSIFNKKVDNGYFSETESTETVFPMLAQEYSVAKKHIIFPCYAQPKLDGARSIYNKGSFFSRVGKKFETLGHLVEELKNFDYIFDGEIYTHGMGFQSLISILKNNKIDTTRHELEYCIFDIVDTEKTMEERQTILRDIFEKNTFKNIKLITSYKCENFEDILKKHSEFIRNDYEGTMIKNKDGKYKKKYRSKDLIKYKDFLDKEFKIIGFNEGRGLDAGCVIWICKTDDNVVFTVRPKGTKEQRKNYLLNADSYVNKFLTVKFQEYTKDGIPRFPVGICIRDYE
jgi:DNA ligase-1